MITKAQKVAVLSPARYCCRIASSDEDFSGKLSRLLMLGILAAVVTYSSNAQGQPSAASQVRGSALLPIETFTEVKVLAAAGNVNAAEAVLIAQVRATPHSFEWYVECGRYLTRLAVNLEPNSKANARETVAARAVAYFAGAESMTTHPATQSNLRTSEGMLQERYLNDPVAAKASYARALSVNSNNNLAASALRRLESIDETARARIGRKLAGG